MGASERPTATEGWMLLIVVASALAAFRAWGIDG